jgi:hypothetical protein
MKRFFIPIVITLVLGFTSCDNVDEGYRIDYIESPAQFSVIPVGSERGAINDTIAYLITAQSDVNIKSLIVTTSASGASGTGFEIVENGVDPLIDHIYGTIQAETKTIEILYNFIIKQDTVDPSLTFSLIDEVGKKTITHDIFAVPAITKYMDVAIYANSNKYADGFSTFDGVVYHNLDEYKEATETNKAIQESLDIVFLINGSDAMFVAPYNNAFWSSMAIKNKTLFKKIENSDSLEISKFTNGSFAQIIEDNQVEKGTTQIGNIQVGDIIGFRTDFASTNPFHFGLIKIKALHPTNVEFYDGTSYMIEMDIVTQK